MSTILESHTAPLHVGAVTLRARDMGALAAFYQERMGLDRISATADEISLGSGREAYLHIKAAPDAVTEPDSAAGLFHTAFILPDRASLGRWFLRGQRAGLAFEGASDHAVSEAFYLTDPEGNGIEVYADRPRGMWRNEPDGGVHMTTGRMDVRGVAAEGQANGEGDGRFPPGARIGHVHLKVGDAAEAERFYTGALGLDVTHRRRPDAVFLSSGGYHHHIAANSWMSRGAGPRPADSTGLAGITLDVTEPALFAELKGRAAADGTLTDPWGNVITLRQAPPL